MASKIDVQRFESGKSTWNKWAEDLLASKKKLEQDGVWSVDKEGNGLNGATREWINTASVNFSHTTFVNAMVFDGFVFPHVVDFSAARFKRRADFGGAKFYGDARFRDVTFNGIADFNNAIFEGVAGFRRATFSNNAWFVRCKFKDKAVYSGVKFSDTANFSGSCFQGYSSFDWLQSAGAFSIADTDFKEVPVFTQTSFLAPIRLDNFRVPDSVPLKLKGNSERAAHYRALKKIAVESHDHLRELNFFASEVKERRCNDDPLKGMRFWTGLIYEVLSDFGRSILRPIVWLFVSILGFAFLYYWQSSGSCLRDCAWPKTNISPEFYLSILNSLPLIGFVRADGRGLAEKCLLGQLEAFSPGMDILFIVQNAWSAVLIFFVLLAIRNHFRIN